MGFSVNTNEVEGDEVSPGVIRRVLLKPEDTGRGPPGDLTVIHYTLKEGGVLVMDEPGVEYQDYVVCGSVLFGRRYLHGNTTVFAASGGSHKYIHAGESEARIVSTTYSIPRPSHRWCKTRVAQLTEVYEQQLMTEEFHALTGAHRFHAIDVQTWDRQEHTNPEETAYFMRGRGEMTVDGERYEVRPGTLVYVEEGATHSIRNTDERNSPLHYYVMEYTEQDRMWNQMGYSVNP
jgi:mannose-6-phosphate isomerase-like protein (cupin superfamily)